MNSKSQLQHFVISCWDVSQCVGCYHHTRRERERERRKGKKERRRRVAIYNKPIRWGPSFAWMKKENQNLKWHSLVQNLDDQCAVKNIKLQTHNNAMCFDTDVEYHMHLWYLTWLLVLPENMIFPVYSS